VRWEGRSARAVEIADDDERYRNGISGINPAIVEAIRIRAERDTSHGLACRSDEDGASCSCEVVKVPPRDPEREVEFWKSKARERLDRIERAKKIIVDGTKTFDATSFASEKAAIAADMLRRIRDVLDEARQARNRKLREGRLDVDPRSPGGL
jgi:hypothetical protein